MAQAAKDQQKAPAPAPNVKDAVLFVRAALRPAIRQELKAAMVGEVHTPETLEACIEAMIHYDQALLVLDWDHGIETVNVVLKAAQGAYNVDTRPILLIGPETSMQVVAVVAEYGVARLHTGEVTKTALGDHIDAILSEESVELGLRMQLTRIADARKRDDWDMAGVVLGELQARFPDHRRVNCELVENLIHEERWEQAGGIIDALSVTDGNNLRVRHLRARCLMKSGDFDGATALLQDCQLVNPYNVDRLVDLGSCLLQAARYQDAKKTFEEALRLEAKNPHARTGKLQCRLLEGDVNDALALMRELSGPRELAALFNNAAILAIRHGRFEQGKTLYNTAISTLGAKERLAARLVFNLGLAFMKQQNLDEALAQFERACGIDPQFLAARTNAHAIAAKLGRKPMTSAPAPKAPKVTIDTDALTDGFAEEKIVKG